MTAAGIGAFFEALAVFAFWCLAGLACTSAARSVLSSRVRALIAPAVGSAVTTVSTLALSRAGAPVDAFAIPLAIVIAIASLVTLALRREQNDRTLIVSIAVPAACVLALFSYALLKYGFDWVSFGNADMTNYSMIAQRLQSTGYFVPPRLTDVASGADISGNWWTFTALSGERTGVDANLAFVSSIFRQNPMRSFMLFSFAGYVATTLAAGALVEISDRSAWKSAAVILLVGFSPLSVYGFAYQLLGQTFGLASLAVFGALWLRSFATASLKEAIALGACRALALSGLIAVYPELVPLATVAVGIRFAFGFRRMALAREIAIDAGAAVAALAVLGSYSVAMIHLVASRSNAIGHSAQELNTTFPYYLIPSAFSTLWGLERIAHWYTEPLESIVIAGGFFLTATVFFGAIYFAWKREIPAAPLVIAIGLLTVGAAYQRAGFALYKIAMYVQPFAFPIFVEIANRFSLRDFKSKFMSRPYVRPVLLVAVASVVALVWAPTTISYVIASVNERYDENAAVPNATPDRLYDELALLDQTVGPNRLISDTSNEPLAKMEAGLMPAHKWLFMEDYFTLSHVPNHANGLAMGEYQDQFLDLHAKIWKDRALNFCLKCSDPDDADFSEDTRWTQDPEHTSIVLSTARQSVINRELTRNLPGDVAVLPYDQATNALLLVDTNIGGMRSVVTPVSNISLFQLQPDYFDDKSTMAGLGRYLVFMLPHPSPYFRVIIDFTTTLQGNGENRIPSPSIRANGVMTLPAVGRGSARLISDPLAADTLGPLSLIGINMNSDGERFPDTRTGLLSIFGGDIPRDARKLVGFARDISAVDADYAFTPPSHVAEFPKDLLNPSLFYSGLYEDGYASETSRLLLRSGDANRLRIAGFVPLRSDAKIRTHMTVTVDGTVVGAYDLALGDFDVTLPGTYSPSNYNIQLDFDNSQRLASPDSRIIGAALRFVGFTP